MENEKQTSTESDIDVSQRMIKETTEERESINAKKAQVQQFEENAEQKDPIDILEKELRGVVFIAWGPIKRKLLQESLDFAKNNENKNIEFLNLLVESGGGDPDLAFSSALNLRRCCKNLIVHVPSWAKSAATLLCLAGDEIVMYPGSELGPLDMQVQDPRKSTETVSALSGYRALEAVANFLHTEIDVTVGQLLQRAGTNIPESLSYAMQFVSPLARPLFEQVNPIDLGTFSNALDVSAKYAKELLTRFGTPEKRADKIVRQLVRGYPSHSFVIDIEEAKKIGLKARVAKKDETKAMEKPYNNLENRLSGDEYYGPIKKLGV